MDIEPDCFIGSGNTVYVLHMLLLSTVSINKFLTQFNTASSFQSSSIISLSLTYSRKFTTISFSFPLQITPQLHPFAQADRTFFPPVLNYNPPTLDF